MSSVRILVSYDGEWVASQEPGGVFKFTGSKVKGMSVPKNIDHKGLLEKLYGLLTVDPNEYSVAMKVLYASSVPVPPAEVVNDDDVSFFVSENSSSNVALRTPLCVTLQPRCSLVSLARVEESVPDLCVDDDVGTTSSEELAAGDAAPQGPASQSPVEWVTTREDLDAMKIDSVCTSRSKEDATKEILAGNSVNHSGELELRQLFASKKELQEKLSMLAIKESFEYRVKRSSSKLFAVKCIEEGCEWELRAIVVRDSSAFKVKKLGKAHSCSKETRSNEKHRQASSWVIGQHIKAKCQGIGSYKPRQIIEVVRRELGINLSYAKAWRVKVLASDSDGGGAKKRSPPPPPQPSGRKVGRPKKQRVVSAKGDGSTRNKCGNCGMPGHYRQTCSAPVKLGPDGSSGDILEAVPVTVVLGG